MRHVALGSLFLVLGLVGAVHALDAVDPGPHAPPPVSVGVAAYYDAREALAHMPPFPRACGGPHAWGRRVCRPALVVEDCDPGGIQWVPVWGPANGDYICFDRQTADHVLDCKNPDAVPVLLTRYSPKAPPKLPTCNARRPGPK